MSIFIIAFLGVFVLLNMYINRRFFQHLHLKHSLKTKLRYFLYINFIGIILYMYARYSGYFPNWLFFLVSLPIGVVFLLFCTAVIYDISRVILKYTPMHHSRREFFKKGLDFSSLAIAFALSGRAVYEANFVKLEKVDISIKDLKHEYTIVQLSDLHIGGLIDERFILDIVKRVNALSPDIVVITGDLVDIELSQAMGALEALQKLSSKYGTYFIVGNHEYFHGVDSIIQVVKSFGIRVLENENVYIGPKGEGFNLAGVYDVFGYRSKHHIPDIHKTLQHIDSSSPTVLLAHQPRFVEEVPKSVDLMLSGHTHGGQLYPFRFLVKLQQPYISGLHRYNENLQVYVNKGTGFWGPPMRLGASSEITQISLIPQKTKRG